LPVTAPQSRGVSVPLDQTTAAPEVPRLQVFEGSGTFVNPGAAARKVAAPGDTTLDFADADVRDVVRSVLGEMLQLPYALDPQITGHVTLKTGAPIAKADILPALETALKLNGAAIVYTNGIYQVVPFADAQRRGVQMTYGADPAAAGYGVEIVPLEYIAADEMEKILEPLVPQGDQLRIDTQRNLVFLAGTEPERASLRETIALFDVNYLKSMSFALIQPAHVDAATLAAELDKVFEGTGSPISGLVRLIPITRINSLLVVTSRAAYLHEVNRWVTRLDVTPSEPGRRLYYYRLQNARAKDVSQTLMQLFGGASATPSSSLQAPAFAPTGPAMGSNRMDQMFSPQGAPQPQPQSPGFQPQYEPSGPVPSTSSAKPGGPQIVTDEANNALIIRADQIDYAAIERVIREMDIAPDQVLIEATIAEVTLNDELKYGVEWFFRNAKNQTYTLSTNGAVSQSFPGFAFSYVVPNVQVALSALGTATHVTVVSSPKILTLDNKAASLEVGDQVPIVTQTSVSVNDPNAPLVSTVELRDTGVILSVTPRIGKSGMVFLDVAQEVSDVIPTTTSGIDSPTIQQRRLQSTVGVMDGQTVALGGLIRQSSNTGDSGLPLFKDIPILGNLARTVSKGSDRTELLIFLTPRVIRDPAAAQSMTDDLLHGLGAVRQALEDMKKPDKDPKEEPARRKRHR